MPTDETAAGAPTDPSPPGPAPTGPVPGGPVPGGPASTGSDASGPGTREPWPAWRSWLLRWWWRLLIGVATLVALVVVVRSLGAADVGHRLREADPRWVLAALAVSFLPIVGNVVSLVALSPVHLRFWRTCAAQLATTFTNLLTPASTGGLALMARYVVCQGVTLPQAVTTIAAVQSTSAVASAVLVTGLLLASGRDDALGEILPVRTAGLVLLALLLVGGALLAVPGLRRRLVERVLQPLRAAWPPLRATLTHPGRLSVAALGHVLVPGSFAATLGCCLLAFGESPPWLLLPLVIVASSALAGAVPVPGGIGAAEAAIFAALVTVGTPTGAALSAAVLHRLLTFWGRVPLAWVTLIWLRRRRHV
ncbi:YbhN family protein [Kineococcus gynurae]|uniref:YbhN family protein n=1 Tax=Kineococcus gynurae TaxID=452979 RepID=A0ABV5LRB6_9ACTN